MLKQLLISVVIVIAAAAAYVFFVPGAPELLARFGIMLPVEAAPEPAASAGQGQGAGQGFRQGGAGGRGGFGGNRQMVVVTAPVVIGTVNDKLSAIGEGAAAHSVTVMPQANGTLEGLLVEPGETIKPNTEIGRLDSNSEQIAFERAKVAQQDADAALTRTQGLANANAATAVQINAAKLAATNAQLELQNAELALRRRTITSPIGGTVGLFQVNEGNTVTAQSVVTTIEDNSRILISFWVPERYASSILPGMPVTASAVALAGETIAGVVDAVDNRIDPVSRTLKVQARIDNKAGRLRPGMSFSVSMSFSGEQFPTVDPLAIQWSSDGAYLWKYVDGKVERVSLSIVRRNSDGVLVRGDLKAGDQVVVQGVQQLVAGASVRLLDEALAELAKGRQDGGQSQGQGGAGQGGAGQGQGARPQGQSGQGAPASGQGQGSRRQPS